MLIIIKCIFFLHNIIIDICLIEFDKGQGLENQKPLHCHQELYYSTLSSHRENVTRCDSSPIETNTLPLLFPNEALLHNF